MSKPKISTKKRPKFYRVLDKILSKKGLKKRGVCDEADEIQLRILNEYGAVFIADRSVVAPPTCMFTSAEQVNIFQKKIKVVGTEINGAQIRLQENAMEKLLEARKEAIEKDFDITPRDGAEAGGRSFEDTVRLWKSRFEPACDFWLKEERLTTEQVEKLKSLPIKEQVREVLNLEKQGIYFNTFFNASILYSVAAPGASQHLSLLAFDANEYDQREVREILARHGWFRTVQNDTPHFTFLGRKEKDLEKMGLKKVETEDGEFWIPNIDTDK